MKAEEVSQPLLQGSTLGQMKGVPECTLMFKGAFITSCKEQS